MSPALISLRKHLLLTFLGTCSFLFSFMVGWTYSSGVFRSRALAKFSFLDHWVSSRIMGDMRRAVSRRSLLRRKKLNPFLLVTAGQIHGTYVARIRKRDAGRKIYRKDALVTFEKGIPLGIYTADCAPVFLVDRYRRGVGLVHAGWRGAVRGIVPKAVKAILNKGIQLGDLHVVVGPHIGACCYQVGWDVARFFPPAYRRCESAKRYRVDLGGWLAFQVQACGISNRKIIFRAPCTFCDRRFFSYRRDRTSKRILSCIKLN